MRKDLYQLSKSVQSSTCTKFLVQVLNRSIFMQYIYMAIFGRHGFVGGYLDGILTVAHVFSTRFSLMDSIRADAWALKSLNDFEILVWGFRLVCSLASYSFLILQIFFNIYIYIYIYDRIKYCYFLKTNTNVTIQYRKFHFRPVSTSTPSIFRDSKLVWLGWMNRGYVSKESIANWRFGGLHGGRAFLVVEPVPLEYPFVSCDSLFPHVLF